MRTVETRFLTLNAAGDGFRLRSGDGLPRLTLAYEIYGELNAARDNAVLLFHALTGSQHAAGFNPKVPGVGELWTEECQTGWWNLFIGPGKALDTDRFCVICANYVGGCYGSTGPTSTDPRTGKRYGASFPRVTFSDTVAAQMVLLEHLGIERLHATIGSSTGGVAVLSLATLYPDRVNLVIPVATGISTTPLQRIYNLEQIYAIENDPRFQGGHYEPGQGPHRGLALARMISHKSFVSLSAMERRARLEVHKSDGDWAWYELTHPLESYMLHQGSKLPPRFDANSYLRILDAWQRVDLLGEAGVATEEELFARCRGQRYLVFSIDSDVCYYPEQQEELVQVLKRAGVPVRWITVHSEKGHDSFLVEPELFAPHLAYALAETRDAG
jgi:homoserine O-acetyltransferase